MDYDELDKYHKDDAEAIIRYLIDKHQLTGRIPPQENIQEAWDVFEENPDGGLVQEGVNDQIHDLCSFWAEEEAMWRFFEEEVEYL